MDALELLKSVGVEAREIEAALADDPAVREGVIRKAQEVQEYWRSIAPVNKEGKPHRLPSGHVDEPGDYRDSIRIKFIEAHGEPLKAVVKAYDYKAHWLEYGSRNNPEHGYAQKTVDHFGGEALPEGKSVGSV